MLNSLFGEFKKRISALKILKFFVKIQLSLKNFKKKQLSYKTCQTDSINNWVLKSLMWILDILSGMDDIDINNF